MTSIPNCLWGGEAEANSCAKVTRLKDGYQRTSCGDPVDYFDLDGHFIRQESGDYKMIIHYAGKHPDRIEDSLGQKIFLEWTISGRVVIASTDKDTETYNYGERNDLINQFSYPNGTSGNFYNYQYDGNHNLTKIGYSDDTHMLIQYDENGLATSVTEPDGTKTSYAYRSDPERPASHYWTTTTLTSPSGQETSREEEYTITTDAAGVEHLASYSPAVGESKKNIEWDEKGRIKRINKPDGGYAEYFYDPSLNKVSRISTDKGVTEFGYNEAGDLINALTDQGMIIKLRYDRKKHINRIIETNVYEHLRRELRFKYNAQGKPITITLAGKGSIRVEYNAQGEIANVQSNGGAKIALEVTEIFQSLLEVVKVAGVDMGI